MAPSPAKNFAVLVFWGSIKTLQNFSIVHFILTNKLIITNA